MQDQSATERIASTSGVVLADGEAPAFGLGQHVRISARHPVGHYRVPLYLRGRTGLIEAIIEPAGIDNEQEAYVHNAGMKRHYYRLAISMTEIWPSYVGSVRDGLHIEVFETWLERI